MMKKKAQQEIRKILFEAERKIGKLSYEGVSRKYAVKIGYMMMWLRLCPCKYKFLNNWHMPDMRTIREIEKQNSEEIRA